MRNPAKTAVYRPACGDTPEAIAKAIASGRATSPTVIPARRSETKVWSVYFFNKRRDFGDHSEIADMEMRGLR
jgi:hypothetical protein